MSDSSVRSAGVKWRRATTLALDRYFAGEVGAWIYLVLRVGIAGVLLVREADWLRPWFSLDHQRWVQGLDFSWTTREKPYLVSPLLPGFGFGPGATYWLVRARTLLGCALLVGVLPRASALLLALTCYALLFADRYRYFHHLHVLYLSVAWLALVPASASSSFRRQARAPAWPLQLLRAWTLSIYVAAGSAKLNSAWLSGETLSELARLRAVSGPTWGLAHRFATDSVAAKLVCFAELSLPFLLALPKTRRAAVLLGVVFHLVLSACMQVSTFGVEMSLLLLSFWPERERESVSRE